MDVLQPTRVERKGTITLKHPPDQVFPLLCPVREVEWVQGWDPKTVYSYSGVIEPDCVFITVTDGDDAVWVVTRHDPAKLRLEMVKLTPGETVGKISIQLRADGQGRTEAKIAYAYTALSVQGNAFVAQFSDAFFQNFIGKWQVQLNHFLDTGGLLDEMSFGYE